MIENTFVLEGPVEAFGELGIEYGSLLANFVLQNRSISLIFSITTKSYKKKMAPAF
jgi:hypothetical protein